MDLSDAYSYGGLWSILEQKCWYRSVHFLSLSFVLPLLFMLEPLIFLCHFHIHILEFLNLMCVHHMLHKLIVFTFMIRQLVGWFIIPVINYNYGRTVNHQIHPNLVHKHSIISSADGPCSKNVAEYVNIVYQTWFFF